MLNFAIMILRENEEKHPRHEVIVSAENKEQALHKAKLYIEAWGNDNEELQVAGVRSISQEEKQERLDDALHYLAEGYKKYQETPKELG